ncbi:MAG: hypothetical protein BHW64_03465 [Candidatus Melainabacteria bacterium LEY3_CP_29_8]|nr:MAG: hypothetical protein BHW64_03465 [Candidatus Melainabacteria bacterium LEY3_CP_29_8]
MSFGAPVKNIHIHGENRLITKRHDIFKDFAKVAKKLSESTNVSYDLIKSKLKDSEKKVIITHKPKNIKINKYEKASKYILYRMINDNNMILYYFNNLSYLPNDTERKLEKI